MAAVTKLAKEEGISVREAERQLDTNGFLDEYLRWEPCGLHHPFLIHQMFAHTVATGWREYDLAIPQGWWQPSPEWNLSVKPPAIELLGPISMIGEIRGVYNEVYQLQRAPNKSPWDVEAEEKICQKILNSVKECLQHMSDHAQPEEKQRQSSVSTSRPDPQAEYQDREHATYDHYKNLKEGSCKEALAIVWDAHQWVLVAVALLGEKIERLRCSVSHCHQCSKSYKHSGSHHWRSWDGNHQGRPPSLRCTKDGHPRDGPNPPTLGN